jgi:hypothetical protein
VDDEAPGEGCGRSGKDGRQAAGALEPDDEEPEDEEPDAAGLSEEADFSDAAGFSAGAAFSAEEPAAAPSFAPFEDDPERLSVR